MTEGAEAQASLEAALKDEILRMYQEVADNPRTEFHFYHGREPPSCSIIPLTGWTARPLRPSLRSRASAIHISGAS